MTAAHPISPTLASAESRGPEPSMEEILASIRRIIADDQSLPSHSSVREQAGLRVQAGGASAPVHRLHPEPTPEVPEPAPASATLDTEIATPAVVPPEPVAVTPDAPKPVFELKPILEPRAPEAPLPAASSTAPSALSSEDEAEEPLDYDEPLAPELDPAGAASLFSSATNQSVSSAFGMLAATRLADNSDELLAVARDMIRPMLKNWLDDNLPSMVERLVRAEIERVSRGGR